VTSSARHELRVTALRTLRGRSYWARVPITRLDLSTGAYDGERLACEERAIRRLWDALPALARDASRAESSDALPLRVGHDTRAAQVVGLVARELQRLSGDDVRFVRTRGAEHRGDYLVAVEHAHGEVGREAALCATRLVQAAFDDDAIDVASALRALSSARARADEQRPTATISCAVCASHRWQPLVDEIVRAVDDVCRVAPADIVERGLCYAESRVAVVPACDADGVPADFRARARVDRLYAVMVDALQRGGVLVCPASAIALRAHAAARGRRVLCFDGADAFAAIPSLVASALAAAAA
jgi:Cyanophycin synthase-like N-terminal domain